MADSFHVGIGDVPAVPGLGPDQGWVGMTVQFLVGYELRHPPKR
jgi:hypothetical protein